jgi:hypothetical protein
MKGFGESIKLSVGVVHARIWIGSVVQLMLLHVIDTVRVQHITVHFGPRRIAHFPHHSIQITGGSGQYIIKGNGIEIVAIILEMRQQYNSMSFRRRLELLLRLGRNQIKNTLGQVECGSGGGVLYVVVGFPFSIL